MLTSLLVYLPQRPSCAIISNLLSSRILTINHFFTCAKLQFLRNSYDGLLKNLKCPRQQRHGYHKYFELLPHYQFLLLPDVAPFAFIVFPFVFKKNIYLFVLFFVLLSIFYTKYYFVSFYGIELMTSTIG